MKQILCIAVLSLSSLFITGNVVAGDRLTVVELFTSQGCSSCPPADAAVKAMRDKPGVLTLSWPVDYWDRLGWADTFAHPRNSARQAAYNKRMGRGGVFTPQVIVDGRFQCVGSKKDKIRNSVAKARDIERLHVTPGITRRDGVITVTLPATAVADTVAVRLVWYVGDASVEVGAGENQGRQLHYTNVVRYTDVIADWNGEDWITEINPAVGVQVDADHLAILLHAGYGHGPIIGGVSLPLHADDGTAGR